MPGLSVRSIISLTATSWSAGTMQVASEGDRDVSGAAAPLLNTQNRVGSASRLHRRSATKHTKLHAAPLARRNTSRRFASIFELDEELGSDAGAVARRALALENECGERAH